MADKKDNGQVTAEIDETGENKTKLEYADGTSIVRSQTLPNGSKFAYGHDISDRITAITQSTEEGEENSTQTDYTCGEVTELRSGNNKANYTYDHKRRKKAVYLNDSENAYVAYDYTDKANEGGKTVNKVVATLKNKDKITVTEDLRGNVLNSEYKVFNAETQTYSIVAQIANEYNAKGMPEKIVDSNGERIIYNYDLRDRIETCNKSASEAATPYLTEKYDYNDDGNLSEKAITLNGKTTKYIYGYKDNAAKDLESVTVNGITVMPQSDVLGRNTGKQIAIGNNVIAEEHIAYRKVGDHATNMPSAMRFGNVVTTSSVTPSASSVTPSASSVTPSASSVTPSAAEGSSASALDVISTEAEKSSQFVRLDNLKYAYDNCGNISEIRENGELAARYSYDKLNRLVREDNVQLNKTIIFTYDNNGNILSKKEFDFTLKDKDNLIGSVKTDTLYVYNGDRLLLLGDETFEYDTIGNPTTYRGKKCVWQKVRQLAEYDTNGAKITFTYDGQGRRISKDATNYTYDSNGNLIKQTDGTNTLEFFYDHSGVIGFEHTANNDTQTYIYRCNAQGDIIALFDKSGRVVVKYVYDAWGNHEIHDCKGKILEHKENDEENNKLYAIANLNPFRYRGYYYDTETKLYYLKTRYYDPEIGRFITIDDLSYLDPETINGLNLYAYCGNNPVMAIDPNGTFSLKKLWKKAKKAVGWVVTAAVALAGVALIVGTAIGMAAGTIMTGGLLAGVLIGAGVGILAGMGSNIVKQGGFSNIANMNPWDITKAGLIGGGIGAFSAGMSYSLGVFGESYGGVIGNMLSHIPVLSSIATKTLTSTFTVIGGYVGKILGGYIGGTVMNILGDDIMNKMEGHNADVPNWIMTLFHKFFGQIKG